MSLLEVYTKKIHIIPLGYPWIAITSGSVQRTLIMDPNPENNSCLGLEDDFISLDPPFSGWKTAGIGRWFMSSLKGRSLVVFFGDISLPLQLGGIKTIFSWNDSHFLCATPRQLGANWPTAVWKKKLVELRWCLDPATVRCSCKVVSR